MSKAVLMFSGGQDSTTLLYWAMLNYDEVYPLTFDYGQSHRSEIDAGDEVLKYALFKGAPPPPMSKLHDRLLLTVPALHELGGSSLLRKGPIPQRYDDKADGLGGLPPSFVPGRNAVFLSLAASYAVQVGAHDVIGGMCQTDYSGYPDCRRVFIDAMETAMNAAMPSSAGHLRFVTPLMHLTKAESVHLAKRLGAYPALALTVTCYDGKRPGCGKCPACLLRAKGFAEAGMVDPAVQ